MKSEDKYRVETFENYLLLYKITGEKISKVIITVSDVYDWDFKLESNGIPIDIISHLDGSDIVFDFTKVRPYAEKKVLDISDGYFNIKKYRELYLGFKKSYKKEREILVTLMYVSDSSSHKKLVSYL